MILQDCVLQLCELAPEHDEPPLAGAGLSQARVWVPPPQLTEQAPHAPQPPLTAQAALVLLQLAVVPPLVPAQLHMRVVPQLVRPLSPVTLPVVQAPAMALQLPFTATLQVA